MRWPQIIAGLASAVALALMLRPAPAAAATAELKCGVLEPRQANLWSPLAGELADELSVTVLPIDARPWFFAECAEPERPFDCALEHQTLPEVIELSAEGLDEACQDPQQRAHVIRLVPKSILRPSSRYTLRCESTPLFGDFFNDADGATIATRSTRALRLTSLAGTTAELERRDDTCCGDDPLHLVITPPESDEFDAFGREGGVIEVLHEGEVWYLPPSGGELPWTDEGVTMTSIAANGVRGVSLYLPASAIPEELVLNNFDCTLGRRLSDSALWLLMPLVFLGWSRRRARRREDRRCGQ